MFFITAVSAVTLARHIPTKDSPIYSGPSRLRGIKASQIEGPKKRERRETLTVEWGLKAVLQLPTSIWRSSSNTPIHENPNR